MAKFDMAKPAKRSDAERGSNRRAGLIGTYPVGLVGILIATG